MKTMLKSARMRIMRRRACVRVVPVASVLEQDTSMTTMDYNNDDCMVLYTDYFVYHDLCIIVWLAH